MFRLLSVARAGKPTPFGYPTRFVNFIALLSPEAWERQSREKANFLGLRPGEGVVLRLPLIKALVLRLFSGRREKPGEAEGVVALRPDRVLEARLDRVRGQLGVGRLWESLGRGAGVTVALVDSGVYPHPDLASPHNRIRAFHDLVLSRVAPYDDCGHGTHLAGVIAGSGAADRRYAGIAPEAEIAAVKVLDRWGRGPESRVIAGIQWCVRWSGSLGIRVLNLSLGAAPQGPLETDPCCLAVQAAWRQGLVVVAGAGSGAGGVSGERTDPTSPGACPVAISVGRSDRLRLTRPLLSPASGTGPSVLAPDDGVVSLLAPWSQLDSAGQGKAGDPSSPGYRAMGGTSVATAVVSGLSALLLGDDPELSPDTVKEALVKLSENLPGPLPPRSVT